MTIREIALATLDGQAHLDALDSITRKSVMVELTAIEREKNKTAEIVPDAGTI